LIRVFLSGDDDLKGRFFLAMLPAVAEAAAAEAARAWV